MAMPQTVRKKDESYTINNAMQVLFSMLDEGLDDMEQERVQTIDEAWEEIDRV